MEGDAGARGGGPKRTCCELPAADLLSALPDSLLLHILSFLRMEDAVLTSLLSRRWRHLWTSTPCLDFSCGCSYVPPSFIHWALILHEGAKVRTFRAAVRVPDGGRRYENAELREMMDCWVRFAWRRQVEELELDCQEIGCVEYTLPDCIFTCESLVSLKLEYCCLDPPSRILMSSLRTLTLRCVTMEDHNLKDLLAGCPSLECLTLQNCHFSFYNGIRVERSNSRLRTLKIYDDVVPDYDPDYYDPDYRVHIYAPSISTLVLDGYLRPYHTMKDLSSIVTASLDFTPMFDWKTGSVDYECLADLLHGLRRAQVLKLCNWCIQALSVRASESSLFSSELSIISLELAIGFVTCEFPGIFDVLRTSTKLEFLTLVLTGENGTITFVDDTEYFFDETKYVMSNERSSPTMLQHLKTISIFGLAKAFCAEENKAVEDIPETYQNGLEFIRFLLEKSPVLEKLVINTTAGVYKWTKRNPKALSRFVSTLLTLPRASPNVLLVMQDH